MSDQSITTRELTRSFRSLITSMPLSRIRVCDICESAHVNRKSFYYHYKDKYDICAQFFDTEFPYLCTPKTAHNDKRILYELCKHIYTNRIQYNHLFESEEQNSFTEHLTARLYGYLTAVSTDNRDFECKFFADALTLSIKRWITKKKPEHYDRFYASLILCIEKYVKIT